jgi:hypothetical protein
MRLTLIQRDDCHLCDQAYEVLVAAGVSELESLWIDGESELESRYGLRVPVLRREDGSELDWPFNANTVRKFIAPL